MDESPQVTSESLRRDYDRLAALDESYYGSIARRVRVLIPWLVASIAIVASLGWSYTDYHARQEWQRIAAEQTALANQRAQHIAEYDAWKGEVLAQQESDQALRRRQAERIGAAKSAGDLTAALTIWANLADDIMSRNKDDGEAVRALLDTLNDVLHTQKGPAHGIP